jgi:hypothetical protein
VSSQASHDGQHTNKELILVNLLDLLDSVYDKLPRASLQERSRNSSVNIQLLNMLFYHSIGDDKDEIRIPDIAG